MARARAAGYSALVVTIDTPVAGMRERDFRHGVRAAAARRFWASLPHVVAVRRRVRAGCSTIWPTARLMVFPNVELPGIGPMPCGDVGAAARADDRDLAGPPLDARRLEGPDRRQGRAHGRRCAARDRCGRRRRRRVEPRRPATRRRAARACARCPRSSRRSSGQIEVLMDGGIRRGSDIVKALCLGARAVLIGRAYAWASAPPAVRASIARSTSPHRHHPDDAAAGMRVGRRARSSYVDAPAEWFVNRHFGSEPPTALRAAGSLAVALAQAGQGPGLRLSGHCAGISAFACRLGDTCRIA